MNMSRIELTKLCQQVVRRRQIIQGQHRHHERYIVTFPLLKGKTSLAQLSASSSQSSVSSVPKYETASAGQEAAGMRNQAQANQEKYLHLTPSANFEIQEPAPITSNCDSTRSRSSGNFDNSVGKLLSPNQTSEQFSESKGSDEEVNLMSSWHKNVTDEVQKESDTSPHQGHFVDPATVHQVFYFDTLSFSKSLESKGFTRDQSEAYTQCLLEVINNTLHHQSKHMVSKSQQQIAVQQLMSEIASVKKDMVLLQKSEFSSLRTETEKLSIEMSRVNGHLNDEVLKLKGQFSLDINLERGRALEAHAENEKRLQMLHNKIETEVANLKTTFEIYRNDVFKYAGGTVLTCATLLLGVLRLWS